MGTVKGHEPEARALAGVFEQLTYIQSKYPRIGVVGTRTIEADPVWAVGAAIPLQVAVTVPPIGMAVGLQLRVAPFSQ